MIENVTQISLTSLTYIELIKTSLDYSIYSNKQVHFGFASFSVLHLALCVLASSKAS